MASVATAIETVYKPSLNTTKAYKNVSVIGEPVVDKAVALARVEEFLEICARIGAKQQLWGEYWTQFNFQPVPGPCGVLWSSAVMETYPGLRHV